MLKYHQNVPRIQTWQHDPQTVVAVVAVVVVVVVLVLVLVVVDC